jgi:hypothetical protein
MDLREHQRRAIRARWDRPENVQRRVDGLAEVIRRKIATLPPLTDEQIDKLAGLFATVTRRPE